MSVKTELINLDKIGGKLRVVSSPYYYMIADGAIPGHKVRRVFGYNAAVGAAFEDVCETSATINLPASAVAMEVVSASIADTLAGTGARRVEVHGLNSNWEETNEVIKMNGQTPVACAKTYRRINNFHVMEAGTGRSAAGIILLRAAGAGVTYSQIGVGSNIQNQCLFTVPNNYKAYVVGWAGSAAVKDAKIQLRAKRDWDDGDLIDVFHAQDSMVLTDAGLYRPFSIPLSLPPRCDIKVSASSTGATALVSASIDLFYESIE